MINRVIEFHFYKIIKEHIFIQLRVTFQDEYAVTVGDDGLVILWKLQEVGVSKKDKETTYAEEILITKSDLEEKVN